MKINYNHFGNWQTYARISRIEIDPDFVKVLTDDKGQKKRISGRILVDVKMYPSEEAFKQFGNKGGLLLPRFENIPIEGMNFDFCNSEISNLANVLETIICERMNKAANG
jgi:hypothetical protein